MSAACKFCSAPIEWKRVERAWIPQVPGTGERHICHGSAPRSPSMTRQGKTITGPLYKPACEECGIPPWLVCPCSVSVWINEAPNG